MNSPMAALFQRARKSRGRVGFKRPVGRAGNENKSREPKNGKGPEPANARSLDEYAGAARRYQETPPAANCHFFPNT